MKTTKGLTANKMTITNIDGIDPITVYYEDYDKGQGRIVIICYDQVWNSYWGSMGKDTILEFFVSSDEHYLAKNLSKISVDVVDFEKISDDMGEPIEEGNMLAYSTEIFAEYGYPPELPHKANHEYVYLCRIIKTVQEAIKK